jgi:hypothetical protein
MARTEAQRGLWELDAHATSKESYVVPASDGEGPDVLPKSVPCAGTVGTIPC